MVKSTRSKWVLFLGGTVFLTGLGLFAYWRCVKPSILTKIKVMRPHALAELCYTVREKYSAERCRVLPYWRSERRNHEIGSTRYFDLVRKQHNKLNAILKQMIDETLDERKVPWSIYDDSVKYYKGKPDIGEALSLMREPINQGPLPASLTVTTVKTILDKYQEKLAMREPDTLSMYCIEDEIYKEFAVEFELIERAFDIYWEECEEYEELMTAIKDAKLVDILV